VRGLRGIINTSSENQLKKVIANVSGGAEAGETLYEFDQLGNRQSLKTRRYADSERATYDEDYNVTVDQLRNDIGYTYTPENVLSSMSFDLKTEGASGSLWLDGEDNDEPTAPANTGDVSFTYDAKGNMLTKSVTTGGVTETTTFTYDHNNRLVSATMPDGEPGAPPYFCHR
jgi:YD repeat-containing protein